MLLSSCVIWRYRDVRGLPRRVPGGDQALQRVIVERLDEALDWLESLGAPVIRRRRATPRTVGRRFDPRGLTDTLVRSSRRRSVRLAFQGQSVAIESDVLCTGGVSSPGSRANVACSSRQPVERGRRARRRARARGGYRRRPGRVLRPHMPAVTGSARPTTSGSRSSTRRTRRSPPRRRRALRGRALVVGDRRRPADRALARQGVPGTRSSPRRCRSASASAPSPR